MFEALITDAGIDGDRQRDRRFHGGPDRAIVLFSLDVIRALQREGHAIAAGTTGENLTLSGIDWTTIVPGTELAVGQARLLITKFTSPCEKIAGSFSAEVLQRQLLQVGIGPSSQIAGNAFADPGQIRLCGARAAVRTSDVGAARPEDFPVEDLSGARRAGEDVAPGEVLNRA